MKLLKAYSNYIFEFSQDDINTYCDNGKSDNTLYDLISVHNSEECYDILTLKEYCTSYTCYSGKDISKQDYDLEM
jgi:hypothetical protein